VSQPVVQAHGSHLGHNCLDFAMFGFDSIIIALSFHQLGKFKMFQLEVSPDLDHLFLPVNSEGLQFGDLFVGEAQLFFQSEKAGASSEASSCVTITSAIHGTVILRVVGVLCKSSRSAMRTTNAIVTITITVFFILFVLLKKILLFQTSLALTGVPCKG
jgi:hypothetical protein